MRLLPLLLALSACSSDIETGDTGEAVDPWGVGSVHDMQATDEGVSLEAEAAGTYVVVLFSTDESLGTHWTYGEDVDQRARVTPPDPMPQGPEGDGPPLMRAQEGDRREFKVSDGVRILTIEAEAVKVSQEVVVWNDLTTANPLGDVPTDTLEGVLNLLETLVLPRTRQVFGEESDVDESDTIEVLTTFTVNQAGPVAYVTWCDIGDLYGCGSRGNGAEIIYMGIPEPDDPYASVNAITEIFAHELNHLVYAWHKYIQNDLTHTEENIYLTEGMSELAQDLTGFNNGNQYIWASAIDMREFYDDEDYSTQGISVNDALRGDGYYDAHRDGPLRGTGYLYLRYLFEQQGAFVVNEDGSFTDAGGMAWLHDLFTTPSLGVDAIEETMGADFLDLTMDWYTALLLTGRGINDDPRYSYMPRVQDPITKFEFGVDTYANIHGWLQLSGPPVQPLSQADGLIRAGGVEYLEVVLDAPGLVQVPVAADALARARLVRVE